MHPDSANCNQEKFKSHVKMYTNHFQLHNKYFRAKKNVRELHRGVQFHRLVFERLEEIIRETETARSTYNRRCAQCKCEAPLRS